jgi:tricorn protease
VIGEGKGKWLIEGPGVYPDYDIENDPASVLAGKDTQLDAAINYLLKEIKDNPKKLPPEPNIPHKESNFPKR